jgi:hypothetical protein
VAVPAFRALARKNLQYDSSDVFSQWAVPSRRDGWKARETDNRPSGTGKKKIWNPALKRWAIIRSP